MEKNQQHDPKKEFDSTPVYNENYLKTKIKPYNRKIDRNVHNNKTPKEGSQSIYLSVILIDLVYRKNEDYYPQVFLEECKYAVKEEKMSKFITDDKEIFSVDSEIKYSDEKSSDE